MQKQPPKQPPNQPGKQPPSQPAKQPPPQAKPKKDDDDWDEDTQLQAPKYLEACLVIKEYIPESNDHLTLELDDTIYVFNKNTGKTGFWEGEARGIYGIFPSSHVKKIVE